MVLVHFARIPKDCKLLECARMFHIAHSSDVIARPGRLLVFCVATTVCVAYLLLCFFLNLVPFTFEFTCFGVEYKANNQLLVSSDETKYHFFGNLNVNAIFPQLRFGKIATSRLPQK